MLSIYVPVHINKHDIPLGWCNCKLLFCFCFCFLPYSLVKRWRINKHHGIRQTMLKVKIRQQKEKLRLENWKNKETTLLLLVNGIGSTVQARPLRDINRWRRRIFLFFFLNNIRRDLSKWYRCFSISSKNDTFQIQWHKLNSIKNEMNWNKINLSAHLIDMEKHWSSDRAKTSNSKYEMFVNSRLNYIGRYTARILI